MIRASASIVGLLGVLVLLGSCASGPRHAEVLAETAAAPAPAVRVELLAEVRAAGHDAGDVIQVQPLRDPATEDLRRVASAAEARGDYAAAAQALEQALELSANDPQLMQEFAELLLAQDRLGDAAELATRSYDLGPKLGGLCRRNWTTIQLVREQNGDAQGAAEAADQVSHCLIEPPVRM